MKQFIFVWLIAVCVFSASCGNPEVETIGGILELSQEELSSLESIPEESASEPEQPELEVSEVPSSAPASSAANPASKASVPTANPMQTPPSVPRETYQQTPVDMSGYIRPSYPADELETLLSLDNTGKSWAHYSNKQGMRPIQSQAIREMLEKHNGYYIGEDNPKVYLTFDCGYENGYTNIILDTLKAKNVPAAFFITYPFAKENWQIVERMLQDGHMVGNHSVTHPNFANISTEQTLDEIARLDEFIYSGHGGYKMQYFRFPSGNYSERQLALCKSLGYKSVFWSFAYVDYDEKKQPSAATARDTVLSRSHPGAVILLHAISKANAYALPEIIDGLRAKGFELVPLDF